MIRILQSIAEYSGHHLESTCGIHLKQVRAPDYEDRSVPADGSLVILGVSSGDETGALFFTYSESVCRHIALHILGQQLQECKESDALETILEVTSILVAAALKKLKEQDAVFSTTPAVAGMKPACHFRMNANTTSQSVTLDTDRGPISCGLVTSNRYRAIPDLGASSGRTPRLLIVDDCAVIRSIIEQIASRMGFETECAENGTAALVKVAQFEPDVMTLDITMPGMDGITCLRKVKSIKPGTAVIMVTGTAQRDQVKQSLQYGAHGYILKPFRGCDLENRMREFLGQRTSQAPKPAMSSSQT